MEFNQRLMGLRKQKGWSQEQLGERVGVTRQTVSKWELGDTTPEMNKLIDLSRVFELSLDELAGQELSVHKKEVHHYRPSYEYKSKRTFRGLPLVHINIGPGLRRARGVIAIGNAATGIVAMGVCSAGVISLGGLSAGIISVGGFQQHFFYLLEELRPEPWQPEVLPLESFRWEDWPWAYTLWEAVPLLPKSQPENMQMPISLSGIG